MEDSITGNAPCPCGLKSPFEYCCGRYISGAELAPTAEALMRSRYSAYATNNLQYVQNTWHPESLPADLRLVPDQCWIGLKIKHTELGQAGDESGVVEFVARYKRNGRAKRLHEVSYFTKQGNHWLYLRGDHPKAE